MDPDTKVWERPWSLEEIRENQANWNLAGDAGLLKHLEEFSKEIITKTHLTKTNFDNLFTDIHHTSTDLSNVTNSFLYLSNTQFVESRVYDDDDEQEDEPTNSKNSPDTSKLKSKQDLEAEKIDKIREAFEYGISILDSMYEIVEVPATSDSEDEASTSHDGVFLKPKDPYMERSLPYLIGSKEFMEDDNIGLQDFNSDYEESPDHNFDESSIGSDLEMDINKTQFDKLSDISTEMSNKASPSNKINSTDDVVQNMFGNTENTNLFNENLLRKSSSGFTQSNEGIESENSLFNEPYKDDIFGSDFANEDNLFFNEKDKNPSISSSHNNLKSETLSDAIPSTTTKNIATKIADDLFAENDDDDDDDLFQTNNVNKKQETPVSSEKGKPPGGVPIFKDVDIFKKNPLKKVMPNELDEEEANDLFSKNLIEEDTNKPSTKNNVNINTNPVIPPLTENKDLFNEEKPNQQILSRELPPPDINEKKNTKKISSLFSDSDSENEDFLFVSKSSKKNVSPKSDVSSDIFSDHHSNPFDNPSLRDPSKINIKNIFDDVEDDLFSNDIFNTKENDNFNIIPPNNLFDDNNDDQNSIFKKEPPPPIKNDNIIKPNPPKTLNLLKTAEITDIFEPILPVNDKESPHQDQTVKSEEEKKVEPNVLKDPSKQDDIIINIPSKPVILQSALKERARIQTKRKPPTRKARQESYKQTVDSIDYFTNDHSSREFLLNNNNEIVSTPTNLLNDKGDINIKTTLPSIGNHTNLFQEDSKTLATNISSLLSPSTDEEDIFGIPQDTSASEKDHLGIGSNIFQTGKVISPKESSTENSGDLFDPSSLFGNNKNGEGEDDDLFSGQSSTIIKIGHATTSTSLFDDDDNLFDTLKSKSKPLTGKLLTNSLFDDDDNDDIFFTKKN